LSLIEKVFAGREDIPEEINPICKNCIANCREKYTGFFSDIGIFHEDGFAVNCSFIPKDLNYWPIKLKEKLGEELWTEANALRSPLLWTEKELSDPSTGLPWKAWEFQRAPLLCTSNRIVLRFGRRLGKSSILASYILWYLFTSGGGRIIDPETGVLRRNLSILVMAPQKSHIQNIFDRIRAFISLNPQLADNICKDVQGSPQEIVFKSDSGRGKGNKISGFASGDASGSKGLSARGQDADLVIVDELAFISESVMKEVIAPILYTKASTSFIAASTPSGIPNDYFEEVCTKRPDFKEFYVPATERPDWEKVEEQMRKEFGASAEKWEKEVLARFSQAGVGVYKGTLINLAKNNKSYSEMRKDERRVYTFGVDWNKEHGTEIAIVGTSRQPPHRSELTYVENIPKKEFTSPYGGERIVELNRIWNPSWIYVDAGGGDGGQFLQFYGKVRGSKNKDDARLMTIVKAYDFGKNV